MPLSEGTLIGAAEVELDPEAEPDDPEDPPALKEKDELEAAEPADAEELAELEAEEPDDARQMPERKGQ